MERKRQNLILFFEENYNDEKNINSTMVLLHMNRFIIREEDQSEIFGVYNLAKPKKNIPLIELNTLEPAEEGDLKETQFWKDNQTKLEHDKSIFENLASEIEPEFESYNATLMELKDRIDSISVFNHFIIGSSFYGCSSRSKTNFINETMQDWINENYRSFYDDLVSKYAHDVEAVVHADDHYVYKHRLIKNILQD